MRGWVSAVLAGAIGGCAGAEVEPPLPLPSVPVRPAVVASNLDARLARFRAEGRSWRSLPTRPEGPWPLPVLTSWRALLADLEPSFRSPKPTTATVRAYVAVEAELDRCRARFGPPPEAIAEGVRRTGRRLARIGGWDRKDEPTPAVEWPVTPVIVTSPFGHRRDPIHGQGRFHAGLDLGGRLGDVVNVAAPGTVVEVGWHRAYGRRVVVRHGPGLETWYGHLSRVLVRAGDRLALGEPVGLMGSTGRTTGPHLHFEVRIDERPVDPSQWFSHPEPAPSAWRASTR